MREFGEIPFAGEDKEAARPADAAPEMEPEAAQGVVARADGSANESVDQGVSGAPAAVSPAVDAGERTDVQEPVSGEYTPAAGSVEGATQPAPGEGPQTGPVSPSVDGAGQQGWTPAPAGREAGQPSPYGRPQGPAPSGTDQPGGPAGPYGRPNVRPPQPPFEGQPAGQPGGYNGQPGGYGGYPAGGRPSGYTAPGGDYGGPYGGNGGQGASYTAGGGFATAQPYDPVRSQPEIEISPVEEKKSEPVPKKGLWIFCAILVGVLLLCAVAAGGYFAGRSGSGAESSGTHAQVDLASKPEGTITDEENQNATYVFEAVMPSVVGIEVYSEQDTDSRAQASGVIYTEDGYIVTNDHIYADIPDPKFLILMADGSEYDATYVAGDSRSDLAVLKVEASGLPAATFGNSDELQVGEAVMAIGNPGGQTLAFSATQGVVSAVDRRIANASSYSMKFIQTDTAINPGNSGGALVNMYGQVVGITSWKYVGESYERIGFAIPTTTMKTVVDSLIENKYVAGRAKLGITYQAIDAVTAKLNSLPRGLQVVSVNDDSDLKGKVSVGDVLTHINDTAITDGSEVLEVLENAAPGDTVTFRVYTSGKQEITVTAVLLEDRGTSSYTLQPAEEELPGNNSTFDFPFGD